MTEGNVIRLLISFASPLLLGNIFQQFYNVVDTIIVGKNALAAIGSIGSLIFLLFSLCAGMSTGIGILVSRYFGASDDQSVKKAIGNSIYVILICGMLMSGISILLAIKKTSYFRLESNYFTIDQKFIMQSIKLGLPIALQQAMVCTSCVILQSAINGFGENVIAAYIATAKIEQLYTNCEKAELFLNGVSFGQKEKGNLKNLEWFVPYEPGIIEVKGYEQNQLVN